MILKPSIAILIVFFNKAGQTIDCIKSFLPSDVPVYVFNNGSDKHQWLLIRNTFKNNPQVNFFSAYKNSGPAVARNELIKRSTEDWLFFADNDITVENKNWYGEFEKIVLANHPDVICPVLFNIHENEFAKHPKFILNDDGSIELDYNSYNSNYFPSGASIVNRKIFDEFGMFDDRLHGFEDYEYAIRLLKSGKKISIVEVGNIRLNHAHIFQKAKKDKLAAKERYDMERLEKSFGWIEKKHQVTFDHNWQWWTNKQRNDMTNKNHWGKLKSRIRQFLPK